MNSQKAATTFSMSNVQYYRKSEGGLWREYVGFVRAQWSMTGLEICELRNGSRLAQVPKTAVTSVREKFTNTLAVCHAMGELALKYPTTDEFNACKLFLQQSGCTILPIMTTSTDKSLIIPSLNDPKTQELVLKLLFTDEFNQFAGDVRVLLDAMKEKIDPTDK